MSRFKKLQKGEIKWSSSIREWIKENEKRDICNYCGKEKLDLTIEHIMPLSKGGIDHPDNAIWVCKDCNLKKSNKRLYQFFTLDMRNEIPRIAEGKYLKMLYDLHEKNGTLNTSDVKQICPNCDMENECKKERTEGKLTTFCLEGIFKE